MPHTVVVFVGNNSVLQTISGSPDRMCQVIAGTIVTTVRRTCSTRHFRFSTRLDDITFGDTMLFDADSFTVFYTIESEKELYSLIITSTHQRLYLPNQQLFNMMYVYMYTCIA